MYRGRYELDEPVSDALEWRWSAGERMKKASALKAPNFTQAVAITGGPRPFLTPAQRTENSIERYKCDCDYIRYYICPCRPCVYVNRYTDGGALGLYANAQAVTSIIRSHKRMAGGARNRGNRINTPCYWGSVSAGVDRSPYLRTGLRCNRRVHSAIWSTIFTGVNIARGNRRVDIIRGPHSFSTPQPVTSTRIKTPDVSHCAYDYL